MDDLVIIRVVLQRVSSAEVVIAEKSQGKISQGLLALFGLGFSKAQSAEEKEYWQNVSIEKLIQKIKPRLEKLTDKLLNLRIFSDDQGKLNFNVQEVNGSLYVVSQFTLFADCSKGNRPSFGNALKPDVAKEIYDYWIEMLKMKSNGISLCTGVFGEEMQVSLCNEGPVTLILEF